MDTKPVNKALIRFGKLSYEFTDSLCGAMAVAEYLHHNQVEGLSTHINRIQTQLGAALETLTAIQAKNSSNQTDKTKE